MEKDIPENEFKDITIRVSDQGEGVRVNIITDEKDSTVITTNLVLALCAIYKVPENYLPELFATLTGVLMKAHSDQAKENPFSLGDIFR